MKKNTKIKLLIVFLSFGYIWYMNTYNKEFVDCVSKAKAEQMKTGKFFVYVKCN